MRTIYVYVNESKPRAATMRDLVRVEARRLGFEETEAAKSDFILAIGGDGTILRAVHEFPDVPVLGLNIGGLGYLSSVGEGNFSNALRLLADGRYRVSERSMLEVRGGCGGTHCALNDIVVVREMSGHAALLDLTVDGKTVTRYLADGLVIATPTGSTAYSLSAGGPVLLPDTCSFVVTPMNPHALGIRSMVVNDHSIFSIVLRAREGRCNEKVGVYADGESLGLLEPGVALEVGKRKQGATIIELDGYDPYCVLANKLGWRGSNC